MPTVAELSGPYANFMLGPRRGPDVCQVCFTFTCGYGRCYACDHTEQSIDVVAPISYSIAREQLHHALSAYKRVGGEVGRQLSLQLAAVLWRFLAEHEECLARAIGARRAGARADGARADGARAGDARPGQGGHAVRAAQAAQSAWANGFGDSFQLATTVPSSDRARDENHPLRRIVAELVGPTRERHERLLLRSRVAVGPRAFSRDKFTATRALHGEPVLLLDDTWTTGANAQSAAAALKDAGAGPIAAVVIGRHLKREWRENDRRLRGISDRFDWSECALCGPRDAGDGRRHRTTAERVYKAEKDG
jgi:hypothetical protein